MAQQTPPCSALGSRLMGTALRPSPGHVLPLLTISPCVRSSGQGVWSNEGCVLAEGTLGYSVCRCTHLTNFAILMQVVPLEVRAPPQGGALSV